MPYRRLSDVLDQFILYFVSLDHRDVEHFTLLSLLSTLCLIRYFLQYSPRLFLELFTIDI